MALSQLQTQKQTQNLSLTPQLLHSIKLLQLSSSELRDHLLEEIEKNPLLEAEEELYRNYSAKSGSFTLSEGREDEASPPSLYDMLSDVLMPSLRMIEDRKAGEALILSLDEAGYLTETVEVLSNRLAIDKADMEAVLLLLQDNAPPGIGARDLKDCLTLQLKAKNRFDPTIALLLDNLSLLAKRDYAGLKRLIGCDDEDLSEMVADIRALDPKPGLAYSSVAPILAAPDVIVKIAKDGALLVQLNPDLLPRLSVNKSYIRKLSSDNPEQQKFVKDMSANAYGLIKMLDQRFETLIKVVSEMMLQQEDFIFHGGGTLKPLTLRDVAEKCNLHESTVSRAVMGKTVMVPQGLFELKHFFTNAINEDGLASDAVRHRIKALIDAEEKPLSDDDLVLVLKSEGMAVARRTVSKYREGLGIVSSVLRKREKALMTV